MNRASPVSNADKRTIEAECGRLVAAYAFLVDHRRYAELVELFVEDGILERPGAKLEGVTAIRAFLDTRPAAIATRHLCSTPFFDKIGTAEASAVTYMTMFHGDGPDEGPVEVPGVAGLGEFHDTFRLVDAGWRIAHRIAKPIMIVKP